MESSESDGNKQMDATKKFEVGEDRTDVQHVGHGDEASPLKISEQKAKQKHHNRPQQHHIHQQQAQHRHRKVRHEEKAAAVNGIAEEKVGTGKVAKGDDEEIEARILFKQMTAKQKLDGEVNGASKIGTSDSAPKIKSIDNSIIAYGNNYLRSRSSVAKPLLKNSSPKSKQAYSKSSKSFRNLQKTGKMMKFKNVDDPTMEKTVMDTSKKRRFTCMNLMLSCCLFMFIAALVILFVVVPITFRLWLPFRRFFIFMNDLRFPLYTPAEMGIPCTRPFNIQQLGVWHMKSNFDTSKNCFSNFNVPDAGPWKVDTTFVSKGWFKDNASVVVYAHGIGGHRGNTHRTNLYKLLSRRLNFHVVTFDYTGYGDSYSDTVYGPTAPQMYKDMQEVIKWVESQGVSRDRIFGYGHSMGTAVMVNVASEMSEDSQQIKGVILEASILSLKNVLYDHVTTRIFSWLPYFESCFVDPVVSDPNLNFRSVDKLPTVKVPILIMHATDDFEVPVHHGRDLYATAKQVQPDGVRELTMFHEFAKGGHMRISDNTDFSTVMRRFIGSLPAANSTLL